MSWWTSSPGRALAGSVKEEDDRPGFLFGEISRDINLVTVGGGGHGDGAIEEAGLSAGKGGERGCENQEEEQS